MMVNSFVFLLTRHQILTSLELNFTDDKDEEAMKALAERVCKAEFEHYAFLDKLKNAARLETFEDFEEVSFRRLQ